MLSPLRFPVEFQVSVNPQLNLFNDDLKPDGRERFRKTAYLGKSS